MAEENQVAEQRVTTKDPKKVETGRRLAEYNRKKKKELKLHKSEVSQCYGIGAVLAVGVIGGLGYYVYQAKKEAMPNNPPPQQPHAQTNDPSTQTNKLEML